MTSQIQITDVTLRDGLQMESRVLTPHEKLALLNDLSSCGYSRLEVTSFVSPKWMPQFSDAEKIAEALKPNPNIEYMAFVPNERGLSRLIGFPIDWAAAFVAVSEAFNRKNVNAGTDESLSGIAPIVKATQAAGKKSRVYISTVFGCPYQGEVALASFERVFKAVADSGAEDIAISDTIGVAYPDLVARVLEIALRHCDVSRVSMHFHNTYGMAIACAYEAYRFGVRRFDGATGGTGGCPYAKGASGNLASEDLQFAFSRSGYAERPQVQPLTKLYQDMQTMGLPVRSQLFEVWNRGGIWFDGQART